MEERKTSTYGNERKHTCGLQVTAACTGCYDLSGRCILTWALDLTQGQTDMKESQVNEGLGTLSELKIWHSFT